VSIKRGIAWLGMGQLFTTILQFVSSIVLARYLTPFEMGLVAVAFAVVAILSIFQQLGLNRLIIREPELTDEVKHTAFTVNAVVTTLLSLAIVLVSYAGAVLVNDERVRHVALVLAICPLFGIFDFIPAAQLEREGRFKTLAAISSICSILGTITTVGFVVGGLSYMSIAYGHVVATGSYAALAIFFGRKHFSLRPGLAAWWRITEFGALSAAVAGMLNVTQRVSEIGLGHFLGLASVGLYNRANSMNMLIWSNVHSVIARVLLVDFANLHREQLSFRERYIQTITIVTAVLWPAFAGLAVTSKPFIAIVYGERWTPAAQALVFLSIASMIQVSITMTAEIFSIKDQMRTQTRIEAIRSVVGLLMFLAACLISLEAAAATRVLEVALAFILYRPHLNKMTDTSFADFKPIYLKNIILTIIAVAPSGIVIFARPGGELSIVELALTILIGVVAWAIALVLIRHPLSVEVRRLWTARRGLHGVL
jgi:O-antigen/teichoic acid export membrane protein